MHRGYDNQAAHNAIRWGVKAGGGAVSLWTLDGCRGSETSWWRDPRIERNHAFAVRGETGLEIHLGVVTVWVVFFFFFFAAPAYRVLGQGSDPSHSCKLHCSNTGPGQGSNLHPGLSKDTADSVVPQQELQGGI